MKTNIKSLVLAATLSIAAFTATATPQYTGNTFGSELMTPFSGDSGYYLWNDEASPSNWSLRWTDDTAGPSWFGDIEFMSTSLGTSALFSFEGGDTFTPDLNTDDADELSWSASTNTDGDIDGIDFSIGSSVETMRIRLGSSIFSGLPDASNDPGVVSTGIFIGSGYASANVLVKTTGNSTRQSFEIHVPAPGALALMGLGLLGLGLARRKQTKK
jgi:hypothetical protein